MSSDITKKQHYVWRNYLSAWKCDTDDKTIWTGFLKQNIVKKVGLMDVAQGSFFYKLEELGDDEVDFLKQFTDKLPYGSKSIAEIILSGYIMFTQLKKDISTGKVKTDQNVEHQIKKIEAAAFESIQSQIELMGSELLKCNSAADIEKLTQSKEYDILYYVWVQYLRTKSMKDRVGGSMEEHKRLQELNRKCWPFFNLVVAMKMVEGMVKRKDYRFVFINNNSETPFITGDQPAINALADDKDKDGFAKKLELFYPLSPNRALCIAFDEGDKYSEMEVDSDFAKSINEKMMEESLLFIFANEEQLLKDMLRIA